MLGFGSLGEFALAEYGTAIAVVTPTVTPVDVGGKARSGSKRRRRSADEELTEAEVQYMMRKLAELKRVETEREKERIAKDLEVALAQAAQDEDAAAVITDTIEEARPGIIADYGGVMRDVSLLSDIIRQLEIIARRAAQAQRDEDDDIEVLLLSQ